MVQKRTDMVMSSDRQRHDWLPQLLLLVPIAFKQSTAHGLENRLIRCPMMIVPFRLCRGHGVRTWKRAAKESHHFFANTQPVIALFGILRLRQSGKTSAHGQNHSHIKAVTATIHLLSAG